MKITGKFEDRFSPTIFATSDEFEAYKQKLWDQINLGPDGRKLMTGWYARQQLRDAYPERFPCLMLADHNNVDNSGDGPAVITNFFVYDFEIHEDERETGGED